MTCYDVCLYHEGCQLLCELDIVSVGCCEYQLLSHLSIVAYHVPYRYIISAAIITVVLLWYYTVLVSTMTIVLSIKRNLCASATFTGSFVRIRKVLQGAFPSSRCQWYAMQYLLSVRQCTPHRRSLTW